MRCFFHLSNGAAEELLDDEGAEVADVAEARSEALKAIAELRREAPGIQSDWNGWQLRIVSETGDVLSTIRLNTVAYPLGGGSNLVELASDDHVESRTSQPKKLTANVIPNLALLGIHGVCLAASTSEYWA